MLSKGKIMAGFFLASAAGGIIGAAAVFAVMPLLGPPSSGPEPDVALVERGGGPGERFELKAEQLAVTIMRRLERRLDLTEEQKPEVARLVEPFADSIHRAHQNNRAQMKEMFADFNEKLSDVLSPEQSRKLRGMRGLQHPPKRRNGFHGRPRDDRQCRQSGVPGAPHDGDDDTPPPHGGRSSF